MKPKKSHDSLFRVLKFLAIAVLSSALAACAVFKDLERRVSQIVETLTGMQCVIASVRPCFPCGFKASGITLCSSSGKPFLQAKEISTQVNLLGYLQKNRRPNDLFHNLQGDLVTLTLVRDENGKWDLPRFNNSQSNQILDEEGKTSPRHLLFTNLSILIKTGAGESTRSYKSMEADLDPESDSVTFKLSGVNESARITCKKGLVKQYELQAENFSLALLAPATTSQVPFENLVISGRLKAVTSDNRNFAVEGNGKVRITNFHQAVVSSKIIEDIDLPFDLKANLVNSEIEKMSVKINLAGETAILQGNIEGSEKPVIDMEIVFNDFSYDRAISALPASLHPNLPFVRLSGQMNGKFRMHLDLGDPDSLDYSYTGRIDPLKILNLGQENKVEHLKFPFLHQVRTKSGKNTTIMLSPENPDFTPYRKIPASLISAVLTAEDGNFFSHRGFSIRHIRGSLIENMKAGKVVRGASTISMQLAKNLYLSPERTLSRKLEEALFTVAIEQNLDKRRIMEIYLNIIEWGNGIYGIGPASRYYFGKRPGQLRPVESAFLASIIARPKNWPPDPLGKIGQGWWQYMQVLLWRMYYMGSADLKDLFQAGVSKTRIIEAIMKEQLE